MRVICVALLLFMCLLKINAGNVWLKDLTSQKGLNLGYGVALKLNESKKGKNVPVMERLSLQLNYDDVAGMSLGNPGSDGVELDFYVNKDIGYKEEGRSKKNGGGKHMIQMLISYKAALMTSIMLAIMKVLTIKAIFLAKAALIISLFGLLVKLKDHRPMEIIEVDQHPSHGYEGYSHHPAYEPHGYEGGYYGYHGYGKDAQPSNVYPGIVYAPSAAATEAETNGGYATILPNGSVQTVSNSRNDQDSDLKKNKLLYRKHRGTVANGNLMSIKEYASSADM